METSMTEMMQSSADAIDLNALDFRFAISNVDPRVGRVVAMAVTEELSFSSANRKERQKDEEELPLQPCHLQPRESKTIFNDK